jgi:outer membrane protein assembly factor BamB
MNKKCFHIFVIAWLLIFSGESVYAKRGDPPKIEPIIYKDIRIEVPNYSGTVAVVLGYDNKNNELLWSKTLYTVRIFPFVEEDTQYDFIEQVKLEGDKLFVTSERGKYYELNPQNGRVLNKSFTVYIIIISGIIIVFMAVYIIRRKRIKNRVERKY